MKRVHERRHVQTALTAAQYARFQRAAKRHGLSIQDALRQAVLRWTFTEGGEKDPFDALIGKLSGPTDASVDVDEIYDED
jgi:hypothetical protein